MTVKIGDNGAAVTVRNVETGKVASFTLSGPKEIVQDMLKLIEENPEIKIKYE